MSGKCAVFIDGGYLENLLIDLKVYRIDFNRFSEKLANGSSLLRTYYYNCLPFEPDDPQPEDMERMEGKKRFYHALTNIPRYEVRLGYAVPRGRDEGGRLLVTQKGVDVQLAVDLVRLSYMRSIDCACLVAGDGDFTPMVQTVKDAGVVVKLFHGEGPNSRVADRLIQVCDERSYIDRNFFEDCRL
jgi:uncharacterized LabA/DUF88 family protein